MRRTTTIAVLAAAVLALAGCSSSDDSEPPKATATVTKTPERSQAELRAACVDAWVEAIDAGDEDDEPSVCAKVEGGQHTDMYMEGLKQRNQANRDEIAECVDDPSCTSVPVP